jgi:hypothetical protein
VQSPDEATWQVLFAVHRPHRRRKSFGIRTFINRLTKYVVRMGIIVIRKRVAPIAIIIFNVYSLYSTANLTDIFAKFFTSLVNFFIAGQYTY